MCYCLFLLFDSLNNFLFSFHV
uniref:Uncharacterized protein n=1 Tax=Rhizophora mucronata TaxID=61149 RepID=A0A2P2NQZ0_RHIMU